MIYFDNVHLVATTLQELHKFAESVCISRRWFYGSMKGHPHYDVPESKKEILKAHNLVNLVRPREVLKVSKDSIKLSIEEEFKDARYNHPQIFVFEDGKGFIPISESEFIEKSLSKEFLEQMIKEAKDKEYHLMFDAPNTNRNVDDSEMIKTKDVNFDGRFDDKNENRK